ncbi:MAG: helix-turn-helix transcriptional regulator [Neisseriaceae bacterium]|nr:helix-turn-helix transcriptional regulator [Neisseriaceae bacterium]MBP6862757.1 helix-turn-helix transcriptional regulator [Neisseriaceae bacterium]
MNASEEKWGLYYDELCATLTRLLPIDGVLSCFVDPQAQARDYRFQGINSKTLDDYWGYAHQHDPVHYRHAYDTPEVGLVALSQKQADPVYVDFLAQHQVRDTVELFFREQGRLFFCISLIRLQHRPAFWAQEWAVLQSFQQATELSLRHFDPLPHRLTLGGSVTACHYGLTKKEQAILQLVCQGLSHKAIAAQSFCSIETVKTHIRHLLRKTQTRSKHELMHLFLHGAAPLVSTTATAEAAGAIKL